MIFNIFTVLLNYCTCLFNGSTLTNILAIFSTHYQHPYPHLPLPCSCIPVSPLTFPCMHPPCCFLHLAKARGGKRKLEVHGREDVKGRCYAKEEGRENRKKGVQYFCKILYKCITKKWNKKYNLWFLITRFTRHKITLPHCYKYF